MIRIENKRTYGAEGIYVGRPSLFGNPFKIGVHGEREDVIRFYRQWLCDRTGVSADERAESLAAILPIAILSPFARAA